MQVDLKDYSQPIHLAEETRPSLPPQSRCLSRVIQCISNAVKMLIHQSACYAAYAMGSVIHGHLDPSRLSLEATHLMSNIKLPRVIDVHLHVVDFSHLHPRLISITWSTILYAATGSCMKYRSTERAVTRLQGCSSSFPKLQGFVLPIHPVVNEEGIIDWNHTISSLSHKAAIQATQGTKGKQLHMAVSIHPNDKQWTAKLESAHKEGIRLVKWYPTSGIDPSSKKQDSFYRKIKQLNMVLIAHSGPSHATNSLREWSTYGSPKNFSRALQLGVDLILAHSGHDEQYQEFEELARNTYQKKWQGKLYGDLGAILHYSPEYIKNLIRMSNEVGIRIIYGSDFPYTNMVRPFSDPYDMLARNRLLPREKVAPLKQLRNYNPLFANFIAVRNIRDVETGQAFPDETFTGEFLGARLDIKLGLTSKLRLEASAT